MSFTAAQSLSEQIADYIREKIIRFELKPGEVIREAGLAKELEVSRSPIREALKMLEKQRLVEQTPRKGTKVTGISEAYIDSLYDVAIALIILAARLCAERSTPKDLAEINETVLRAAAAVEKKDVHAYYTAFFAFALRCLEAARNPILEEMVMDLIPGIQRMQFLTFFLRSDHLWENLEVVERGNSYLQSHDGEMAVQTVIEYITKEKKVALETLREDMGVMPFTTAPAPNTA
ncbi:MAG: GntR family transcriptional regulator [Desulfosudaceae bacterium]